MLLAAKSTGDALSTVGGDVPSMLSLTSRAQAGSFGSFAPAVARNYDTALAAVVTTTTGDATLSVIDPSTALPGDLVNGTLRAALGADAGRSTPPSPTRRSRRSRSPARR